VARALRLVGALAARPDGEATLAELAAEVGVPLSTAYRHAATLRREGFLEDGARPGRLRVGLRLVALAWNAPPRPITVAARPVMEELSAATGETVLLIEPFGTQAICTERVESREAVRLAFERGRILPMHAGASVRALLAFSPPDVVEAVLAGERVRYTPATPTDRDALAALLARVRADGYALSESEMDPGVAALAMPVRAGGRYAVAALSVTGPAYRFTPERARACLPALAAATARLDAALAGRGRRGGGRRGRGAKDPS
jgi:DNA-binding IclR family transcriptional regulator